MGSGTVETKNEHELKERVAEYLEAIHLLRHVMRTYPPPSPRWGAAMDHVTQTVTDARASWERCYGAPAA